MTAPTHGAEQLAGEEVAHAPDFVDVAHDDAGLRAFEIVDAEIEQPGEYE
jgi:hypothetical protein